MERSAYILLKQVRGFVKMQSLKMWNSKPTTRGGRAPPHPQGVRYPRYEPNELACEVLHDVDGIEYAEENELYHAREYEKCYFKCMENYHPSQLPPAQGRGLEGKRLTNLDQRDQNVD